MLNYNIKALTNKPQFGIMNMFFLVFKIKDLRKVFILKLRCFMYNKIRGDIMELDNIRIDWQKDFIGEMSAPSGKVLIGDQQNGMQPYNLLFGALGACFYSTFLSIATKKRLSFDSASVEVSGSKREIGEVRTLENVQLVLTINNPSNEEQLRKSALMGAKFCSIHETISKVAEIKLEVKFDNNIK